MQAAEDVEDGKVRGRGEEKNKGIGEEWRPPKMGTSIAEKERGGRESWQKMAISAILSLNMAPNCTGQLWR